MRVTFEDNVLVNYFIILSKMIDVYYCDYESTKEEIQILLMSLKPGQKLPPLNDLNHPDVYHEQLVDENYSVRLLEGYTLKFVTNRFINETMPDPYLTTNKRSYSIVSGIDEVIECRGLDLHFEWNDELGVLLHNYKPNFKKGSGHDENNCYKCNNEECYPGILAEDRICGHKSGKCITIGLKINGTNIECIDYSSVD